MDRVLTLADPARAARVHRAQAAMLDLSSAAALPPGGRERFGVKGVSRRPARDESSARAARAGHGAAPWGPGGDRVALALWLTLASLGALRVISSLSSGMWLWGLNVPRFLP